MVTPCNLMNERVYSGFYWSVVSDLHWMSYLREAGSSLRQKGEQTLHAAI